MLTLLCSQETVVEKALKRVLKDIVRESTYASRFRNNFWSEGNGTLYNALKSEAVNRAINVAIHVHDKVTADEIPERLDGDPNLNPNLLLIFGSHAAEAAQDKRVTARMSPRTRGEMVPRLPSLLELLSAPNSKSPSNMRIESACHGLKSKLLDEMRLPDREFSERCSRALEKLDDFIAQYKINLKYNDAVSAFFSQLQSRLKEGVDMTGKDEVSRGEQNAFEEVLRSWCDALSRDSSMKRKIGWTGHRQSDTIPEDNPRDSRGKANKSIGTPSARIKVSVLVVEDDPEYAKDLVESYEPYRFQAEPFEIEFVLHVREAGETRPQFKERLVERIKCEGLSYLDEPLTRLHAVIMDYAMDSFATSRDQQDLEYTGIELSHEILRWRPCVQIFLLTGKEIFQVVEKAQSVFARSFWKHDPLVERDELFRAIAEALRAKYRAPFWDALKKFTQRPIVTFHAMALGRGRSAKKSAVLSDFLDFYKENYFLAETSATLEPLDSLLHPVGSIREAQERAAHAFGAKHTRFVTNGTSTANKMVLQSILQPGDAVLIDRNCHISHHYGLVLSGARPYYLEPNHLHQYGISGGIPLETIEKALKARIAAHKRATKIYREALTTGEEVTEPQELPRAIILTNCTFDGVICQPEAVIKMVHQTLEDLEDEDLPADTLQNIVFLFDEAWFAFARFHPRFIEFTGMATAAHLCEEGEEHHEQFRKYLRVYVTQSTHKTLSAFRQGSMIHIWDPLLIPGSIAALRLEEAFLTHTSTSPHSGIIASLDVARRQMELEGCMLVDEALTLAQEFREDFQRAKAGDDPEVAPEWKEVAQYFDVLDEGQMDVTPLPLLETRRDTEFVNNLFLDPTKITLHLLPTIDEATGESKEFFTGNDLKNHLLTKYNLQINKNSDNTILLMVHAGATKSSTVYLKEVLFKLVADIKEKIQHDATLKEEEAKDDLKIARSDEGQADAAKEGEEDAAKDDENAYCIPSTTSFADQGQIQEHDMRNYFYLLDEKWVEWRSLWDNNKNEPNPQLEGCVSATFVNPYPPGYPILVPGQIIDSQVIKYLHNLSTKEIHGTRLRPRKGIQLLVFKREGQPQDAPQNQIPRH